MFSKDNKPLSKALHKALTYEDEGRSLRPLHASMVIDDSELCERQLNLMLKHNVKQGPKLVPGHMRHVFNMGRAVEAEIIESLPQELLWGNWECTECGSYQLNCTLEDSEDCGCDAPKTYHEARLFREDEAVAGSVDLFFRPEGGGPFKLVEIKSLTQEKFKECIGPKAAHRKRTVFYLDLLKRLNEVCPYEFDTEEAIIIYVSKGAFAKDPDAIEYGTGEYFSPFKEFPVKYRKQTANVVHARVDRIVGTAIPERTMCPDETCHKAQLCPVRKQCFAGSN